MIEKAQITLNKLLVEIWMLKTAIEGSDEVMSTVEKAYTVLKNTHIFINQLLVKTLNIKGSVGEGLEGNEEHAFGN